MPITSSAKKALRASERKYVYNLRRRRAMIGEVKELEKLVAGKKLKEAREMLPRAYKAIDKAAKRGVIKANAAARKKSRLVALIKRNS